MSEEEEECTVPRVLRNGTTLIHAAEVHGAKYNPSKVGGLRPGDGDTHGDQVLEVPDCPDE